MKNTNVFWKKSAFITSKCYFLIFFLFLFYGVQAQDYQPGKLRLKLTEKMATTFETTPKQKTASGVIKIGSEALNKLHSKFNAIDYKKIFNDAGKYEKKHRKYGLHLWYEIDIEPSMDVIKAIEEYKKTSGIQLAEPIYTVKSFEPKSDANIAYISSLKASSNDPLFESQWGYHNTGQTGGTPGADISLLKAWDIQTGNSDVIVAIMDSGVDSDHQDLAQNMWVNTNEIPNNGIDDDNNGYIDDINGWGFGDQSSTIVVGSHGTHVAGIVGAVSNNNTGVSGIAGGDGSGNGVKLMSCAIFGDGVNPGGFATAFIYAADNGAVIAQASWGYAGDFYPDFVEEAIAYFNAEAGYDENGNPTGPMQGGLAIFSAGNLGSFNVQFPAADPTVMAIANTDHNDIAASTSNRGDWVDLAAPGTSILSTFPDNTYGTQSGTSFSCPQVSGVAALIVSEFAGNITPDEVRARIVDNADPLDVSFLGSGRLNAYAALQGGGSSNTPPVAVLSATPTSGIAPLAVNFDASGSTDADGDTLSYTINYGDGTSGTGANSAHTYAAGDYTATVTVSDGNGGSDTTSVSISVDEDIINTPPVATLVATPTSGIAPLAVNFDASGSTDIDGDTLSYTINYGDGTSGTGATSVHTYPAGDYTATITVSDGNGGSDAASVSISVEEDIINTPPVALLSATPTSGIAPLAVNFDASGSTDADGDTLSYIINYGDGTSGTGATSAHTYPAGDYTATVTVSDGNGGSGTASVSISVDEDIINTPPVALLSATPTSGIAPLAVNFDASGSTDIDGDTLSYTINYGDGTSGTGATSAHTYAAGDYTATITVSDGNDGSDTTSVSISVSPSTGNNDCQFNTPLNSGLPSTGYSVYNNTYVLGTGGPDLSNLRNFTVNWDLSNNGLYQFSMLTTNGIPSWWNDLLPRVSHNFGSAQRSITITDSGFPRLDGSYYAAIDGANFVLVSINADFTIYFSNTAVAPNCESKEVTKSNIDITPISFPNPVSSTLTLSNLDQVVRITISDMLGKTILDEENSVKEKVINLSNYKSGMYIIKYNRNYGDEVRSVIVKE